MGAEHRHTGEGSEVSRSDRGAGHFLHTILLTIPV